MTLESKKTKGIWGKRSFGGYPGVTHTAKQIIEYMPHKVFYIEPFAGLGRTARYIKAEIVVLNDKSDYAVNYLRKHFHDVIVTQVDFMECIDLWDSPNTIFFIDPPWVTNVYKENPLTFCDRKDVEYYAQIITKLHTLKGDWVLASSVESKSGRIMRKAAEDNDWYIQLVESQKKVLIGKKARTLLMSNKPFIKHRPFSIGMDGFL